eukprot:SAG31_NODE_2632_length_5347_cov_2.022866_2_plen_89_part_00
MRREPHILLEHSMRVQLDQRVSGFCPCLCLCLSVACAGCGAVDVGMWLTDDSSETQPHQNRGTFISMARCGTKGTGWTFDASTGQVRL